MGDSGDNRKEVHQSQVASVQMEYGAVPRRAAALQTPSKSGSLFADGLAPAYTVAM